MEARGVDGWAAFWWAEGDQLLGLWHGQLQLLQPGRDIFAANAFEVPNSLPAASLNDLLTIFLDATHGMGRILNVVNNTGGSSTITNPDTPVTVVSYP